MKTSFFHSKTILALCLCASCSLVATASFAAEGTPKKKATTAKAPVKKVTKADESPESLQRNLEKFVNEKLDSFNRTTLNNINKKKIVKNPDGTFTASYTHFDKDSIQCSYKDSTSGSPVKYICSFSYLQKEMACTAPTEKQALAGPFVMKHQESITEMAKYMDGKWTY